MIIQYWGWALDTFYLLYGMLEKLMLKGYEGTGIVELSWSYL